MDLIRELVQQSTKWDNELGERGVGEDPSDNVTIHEEMSAKPGKCRCDKVPG